MATLNTKIFNISIDLNYENNDKDKILNLIKNLNERLKNYRCLKRSLEKKRSLFKTIVFKTRSLNKNGRF